MCFFDRLEVETAAARAEFLEIPVLRRAVAGTVSRALYLAYLAQAYHHVRHTCPLLARAASLCGSRDRLYQDALFEYIAEEKGHDLWILDDIAALGGDAAGVRDGDGDIPCRVMVGYAYYAVEHVSPYALLGMVHVLEGVSVLLAREAAAGIARTLGATADAPGFSYLVSHGSLDEKHVAFFADLVNRIDDAAAQAAIIDTARIVYRLFGDIFRALDAPAMAA